MSYSARQKWARSFAPKPKKSSKNHIYRARLPLFSFSLGYLRLWGHLSSEEVALQSRHDHEQHDRSDQHSADDYCRERSRHLATDSSRERSREQADAG